MTKAEHDQAKRDAASAVGAVDALLQLVLPDNFAQLILTSTLTITNAQGAGVPKAEFMRMMDEHWDTAEKVRVSVMARARA